MRKLLAGLAALAVAVDLALAFAAPPARGFAAPLTQRIFYVHVPASLAGYAAFAVALGASVLFLQRREERWDRLAACSAEVGVVLTTIGLLTGVVWSRVEFFSAGSQQGFAFTLLGDPKFVTTAALWLVFLGYLALRRSVDAPEARARLSSAYAVLGFVAVPVSYLSSRFSPHPDFAAPGSGLAPGLALYLAGGIACWLVLFACLLGLRLGLEAHAAARVRAEVAA
ncbi:MAG: cytochrome c biogenesis protein [Halobacteriales archaeon]|nr:cytochrome c biogenesis protein [Halobacteriales archaeon]